MEIDSPGERIFNWGYVVGNDAVDEGIVETLSGLSAGQNYVVRAAAHVEAASRGRPKIIIRDETNGADITSLEGPSFHGNHDGLANSATLTDTTARFPQMLVGWTIYNITDGSSATITAISGDMQTITGALSGGTDDDWDISDEYRIVPPGGPSEYDDYPWIETFTFELPTIARNGTVADCVSISVKLVNGVNEGVIKWHQIELLENLHDNPSAETGAGNPWIPDGWSNFSATIDAGDTEQELTTIHSGGSSLEANTGFISGEYFRNDLSSVISQNKFMSGGIWAYGDGSFGLDIRTDTGIPLHYSDTTTNLLTNTLQNWLHTSGVWRATGGTIPAIYIQGINGAAGDRFLDDIYIFELDDVSLTVTPASEANSAESGGLRVDGFDFCFQTIPAGYFTETNGHAKFKWRPRHGDGIFESFGVTNPQIIYLYENTTFRWIGLEFLSNSTMRLGFNDGGGAAYNSWNPGALITEDGEYTVEIIFNATQVLFKLDGITRLTINSPVFFANILTTAYWGCINAGTTQSDAVFIAP
jgi:hypothetical protein